MNYSPIDYSDLYKTTEQLQENVYNLKSINYTTFVENAQDVLDQIEKEINLSADKIESGANDSMSYLCSTIHNAYLDKLNQYVELVNIGYEEESFPFYEWFTCIKDNDWLFSNGYTLAQPLMNIEDDSKIDIVLILMRNIIELYDNKNIMNDEQKIILFNNCMLLTNNLPLEYRDNFIEHFVLSKNMYETYISKLSTHKKIEPLECIVDKKVGYYLNYLYSKGNNEIEIDKILQLIAKTNNEDILKDIASVLISHNVNTSFTSCHKGSFQKIIPNKIESLFELDIKNNSKLTPFIAQHLRKLQEKLNVKTLQFEAIENISNYLEKGYYANYLNTMIPHKELEKKTHKI